MTTLHLLIVCLTVVAVARSFAGGRARRNEAEAPPPRTGCRVTVHTKQPDDQTIFGVLVGDYAARLVLEDAEYVTVHGAQPLPGAQHFATADVAWVDVHQLVAAVPDAAPAEA